jgi:hypothetical protein
MHDVAKAIPQFRRFKVRFSSARKLIAMAGVTVAATAALAATTATAAMAGNVLSQWYPTQYDCQYAGNVYAQRGIISGFSCTPGSNGVILTGWK